MTNEQIEITKKIQKDYIENEPTKFDELTALNKKVKRPAKIFSYIFGTAGSLVLGTGMSLAMKVIGASLSFAMPLGIGIGLVGITAVSVNYFIYKKILKNRQKKYGDEIIKISSELLGK